MDLMSTITHSAPDRVLSPPQYKKGCVLSSDEPQLHPTISLGIPGALVILVPVSKSLPLDVVHMNLNYILLKS
jgi:hypothetical protein